MLDLDVLRCEFVHFVYLWTGKAQWGIDCDVEYFEDLSEELYNSIKIVENLGNCPIDPVVWDNIRACIERIQAAGFTSFCNNC